jgi:hypothetical protein
MDVDVDQTGELAASCFLVNGGNDLRLSEDLLPDFLCQAFRRAGKGQTDAARSLLSESNTTSVREMLNRGQPGGLIASVVLGLVWQQLEEVDRAIACLSEAVAREPNASVYNMLANLYHLDGQETAARTAREQVLAQVPHDRVIQGAYARDLINAGDVQAGLQRLRDMIEAGTITRENHSLYLLYLHYMTDARQETLLAAHRRWEACHASASALAPACARPVSAPRPLRIGYISADFRDHVGSYAIRTFLHHRVPGDAQAYGYSNTASPDAVTQCLARQMDAFRPIGHLDDRQAAELIQADGIDILVALNGYTAGHRLRVLAYRPAPIQVDWGWVNTTGLSCVDYRLTDRRLNPPGSEQDVAETLVRLPGGMLVYDPPRTEDPVQELPALAAGVITFGSCNHHLKINEAVLDLWSQVLRCCPQSRLCIKNLAGNDPVIRSRWLDFLRQRGIDPGRVCIEGWRSREHYLRFYHQIDIALDTFPFNGCITTLEALWMGVPVVSLAGSLWVSRMGWSVLANAGLEAFVAASPEAYVAKAAALASRPQDLAVLRRGMRPMLRNSPLLDGRRLARDLETAYRAMWHGYENGKRTASCDLSS